MGDELKVLEVEKFEELTCEIFKSGTWNKDKYSDENLQQIVDNFNALKDTVKPPAKIGHSEDQSLLKKEGLPAAGWVDKLSLIGGKIVASFRDVPKIVKDLIEKKAYKRVSAEIYPKYKGSDGKTYNNVLRAVAFLGADVPAIDSLSDVQALYTSSDGVKVYVLDVEEFNEEPKKGGLLVMPKWFKVTVDSEDSQEQLVKKLSDAMGVKVNVEDGATIDGAALTEEEKRKKEEEAMANEKAISAKKIEELSQNFQAVNKLQGDKDKEIADLKAQVAALQAQLNEKDGNVAEMTRKLSEIEQSTKKESIKMFVQKAIGEGKILPKDSNTIVALMEQLDDKSVLKFTENDKEQSIPILDALKSFINERPKVVEFKEIAPQVPHKIYEQEVTISGQKFEVKDIEEDAKAKKYAEDNKVSYEEALIAVEKEQK